MTTIVYTEEVMSGTSPSSTNVTRLLVEYGHGMGDTQSGPRSTGGTTTGGHQHRAGSPKPKKKFMVKRDSKLSSYSAGFPPGFNPHTFTITAYLPYDGGKRLKVS